MSRFPTPNNSLQLELEKTQWHAPLNYNAKTWRRTNRVQNRRHLNLKKKEKKKERKGSARLSFKKKKMVEIKVEYTEGGGGMNNFRDSEVYNCEEPEMLICVAADTRRWREIITCRTS